MFGWFRPTCPLATAEKVWVESRMAWLTENLGAQRLKQAIVIEPTDEFFPAAYHASEADALRVFGQVCQWMSIDRLRVGLEIHERINHEDSLGLYVSSIVRNFPARILIKGELLADPERLVATIAHELAHEILLGGGLLQDNNEDLERLTDLTTVFLGLGIFSANPKIRDRNFREGRFSWWTMSKHGYLPLRMHGYGLALFAWARGEQRPTWSEQLRLDARETMQQGLRFLTKTGDSVFAIERPSEGAGGDDPQSAAALLAHGSKSFRFLGLSQLVDHGTAPAAAIDMIAELTHDKDPDISSTAAALLGVVGEPAARHVPRLLDMLSCSAPADRERAAWSLGELRPDEDVVLRELTRLLDDEFREVSIAAAEALGRFGGRAAAAEKPLLRLYKQCLVDCDQRVERIAAVLLQIFPDARDRVHAHFRALDDELCRMAEDGLRAAPLGAAGKPPVS